MVNPAMRHSLADDSMESGLQRTATELLEGEKGLMQSLGRLREVLRVRNRDVREVSVPEETTNGDHTGANGQEENGSVSSKIPPLPHISDTDNLWRVTQELLQGGQPQPEVTFTATNPSQVEAPGPNQPTPTPTQRLFTVPSGLTVNAIPNPANPGFRLVSDHPARPRTVRYNLDMTAQCRAVDDALERISELLADCMEYKERLEEARDRVADVARARKKVWTVIKERAGRELDREGKV
jgi:hypothetical protein